MGEARAALLTGWPKLRQGETIYTHVDSVSRSGMSRHIRCYIVRKGEIVQISRLVARALGWRIGSDDSIVVQGCGMDMCFHTVYTLGRVLWPKGGPLAKSNGTRQCQAELCAARLKEPKPTRERDGGYLLKHYTI